MSTFDLHPDLAARLERLVPPEPGLGDWRDVVRRTDIRRGRRLRPSNRLAVGLAALLVLMIGVATAAYFLLHRGTTTPRPGALTITAGGYNARWPVKIVEVLPHGRSAVVWHCPSGVSCGEPEGIDWSRDGRRVAFTLAALNASSANHYLGLHILDLATARDVRPVNTDCRGPGAVAWAPDGSTLAYDCGIWDAMAQIWLINADGSHPRRLPTGVRNARWPSWSPDGTHVAFAASGAIYTVRPDGTGLRRVVAHGSAPSWSPDGQRIAYRAAGGIRLVTPDGRDVTPARGGGVGPAGAPAWSPDGRELAIASSDGLYVVGANGRHLRRVSLPARLGSLGPRPAWYPYRGRLRPGSTATPCGPC
jgi:dipeptidyl aminopeptidase/acylaminoacyl peptidase